MNIVIYIYNGMTMLDAIGPYEILRNVKDVNIKFVSKEKGEITADSHFVHINSKYGIDEISKADILLIPGSTIAFVREMKDKKVIDWIKKIDATTQRTVSVCTGSIILAATGLLKNKKATSHWKPINMLKEFGVEPTRERIVDEGKYITAAGVSSGIDMAIYLINQLKGEKAAKAAQLSIEYDPKPMFNSGSYLTADKDIIELSGKIMESDAKKDFSLWEMLTNAKTLLKLKNFIIIITLFIFTTTNVNGQSDSTYTYEYLDKSTRFAWLTYGGDLNYLTGGTTQQLVNGTKENIDFGTTLTPRLTIGGIHFWGHADLYVTFPLSFLTLQNTPTEFKDLQVFQGVETGVRLYPLKLQPQRISPFLGISFRGFSFSQEAINSSSENGTPSFSRNIHPIQFGLTYTSKKWHISASGYYNYQNEFDYFISPTEMAQVALNPISFNLSLLRYVDTDRSMRTPKAVKNVNQEYERLKNQNLLSDWFFGIGPSAALQMTKSPYLQESFPFFFDNYSASFLPDVTFGRYFNKIDANLNLSYRTYGDTYTGFDNEINTRRHSIGVESVKFLFNYLGFVPFVGPIVSYENLHASVNGVDYREQKLAAGITFGWDIRVTKTGNSLLRTNLRYYPNLHLNINGEKMMFDHLEFNFIQYVHFLGRGMTLRKK